MPRASQRQNYKHHRACDQTCVDRRAEDVSAPTSTGAPPLHIHVGGLPRREAGRLRYRRHVELSLDKGKDLAGCIASALARVRRPVLASLPSDLCGLIPTSNCAHYLSQIPGDLSTYCKWFPLAHHVPLPQRPISFDSPAVHERSSLAASTCRHVVIHVRTAGKAAFTPQIFPNAGTCP